MSRGFKSHRPGKTSESQVKLFDSCEGKCYANSPDIELWDLLIIGSFNYSITLYLALLSEILIETNLFNVIVAAINGMKYDVLETHITHGERKSFATLIESAAFVLPVLQSKSALKVIIRQEWNIARHKSTQDLIVTLEVGFEVVFGFRLLWNQAVVRKPFTDVSERSFCQNES